MTKTLTKINVIDMANKEIGLPSTVIGQVIGDVLEEVCQSLKYNKDVKISSFGTFYCISKNERMGRNPKTGKEARIAPRRVAKFRPSPVFKNSLKQR